MGIVVGASQEEDSCRYRFPRRVYQEKEEFLTVRERRVAVSRARVRHRIRRRSGAGKKQENVV